MIPHVGGYPLSKKKKKNSSVCLTSGGNVVFPMIKLIFLFRDHEDHILIFLRLFLGGCEHE